jgi:hypothetical protein
VLAKLISKSLSFDCNKKALGFYAQGFFFFFEVLLVPIWKIFSVE